MDDYKKFFYIINPGVMKQEYGDISDRNSLRSSLKCQSFQWYLDNIYPDAQIPRRCVKIEIYLAEAKRVLYKTKLVSKYHSYQKYIFLSFIGIKSLEKLEMKFPVCVLIPWAEKRTRKSVFFPAMVRAEIRYVEKS